MNCYIGVHKSHLACDMPKRVPDEETAEKVKNYMDENPTHSIRNAVEPLKVPRSTVRFYAYL